MENKDFIIGFNSDLELPDGYVVYYNYVIVLLLFIAETIDKMATLFSFSTGEAKYLFNLQLTLYCA